MQSVVNAGALDVVEETVAAGVDQAAARKWWLGELARRANAGTLTAVTQEAHDSANAEIYVSSPKEVEEYLVNIENSRAARNQRLGHQKAKPHQGRQTPASAF